MIANNKKVIGLTGTIASGKSTVADFYASLGIDIVDADVLSRYVLVDDMPTLTALKQHFPFAFDSSGLNRSLLKEKIFSNDDMLKTLNSIMFPAIKRLTIQEINKCKADKVLLVAPLLYESGFETMTHKVICVTCSYEETIRRVTARDGITKELADKIINAQMSDKEKLERADCHIDTSHGFDAWRQEAENIFNKLTK